MYKDGLKSLLIVSLFLLHIASKSQDSTDKLISFPDKLFSALDKKARSTEEKLNRQTDRYLDKLQKQEHKLKKKLSEKDSLLAEQTFGDIDKKYHEFRNTPGS